MPHAFKPHDLPALAVNFGVGGSRTLWYIRVKGAKSLLNYRLFELVGGLLAPLVL